jgi:hypothetical protein
LTVATLAERPCRPAGGKIDKMSNYPDANGTGIADATRTTRHKAKKNARHARSTAGEVLTKVVTKHEVRINILNVLIVSFELVDNFKAILILAMNCMQLNLLFHGYIVTTNS